MRMEHLEYLIVLSQTLSITKAADELFTTHQNVSKMLRQLEQEMGTDLFERTPKGLKITKASEIMLKFAKETLHNLKKAQNAVNESQINYQLSGEIHLYSTSLTLITTFSDSIEEFNSIYPNIRLHIHEDEPYNILRQLNLHDNVLGLVPILNAPEFQSLYQPYINLLQLQSLFTDAFTAVVSNHSPLAKYKSLSIAEFLRYPLALTPNSATMLQALEHYGSVQVGFSTSNRDLYLQTIINNHHVGISSKYNYQLKQNRDFYRQITVLPFEEDLSFTVYLVSSLKVTVAKTCQLFMDFILPKYFSSAKN